MEKRRKWERRAGDDSRLIFPLLDCDGKLVSDSRRRMEERRSHPVDPPCSHSLIIRIGASATVIDPATSGTYHLGRDRACDLRIRSSCASRFHARLEFHDGAVFLTDDSKNGTFIRFEEGRAHYLLKRQIKLEGGGVMSLGATIENNQQWQIRFRYG